MKKIILSLGVLLLTIALYAQKPFDLKTGDILFQTNKARTSFVKAIENVTTSLDDLDFSHVGLCWLRMDRFSCWRPLSPTFVKPR